MPTAADVVIVQYVKEDPPEGALAQSARRADQNALATMIKIPSPIDAVGAGP